MRVFACLFLNFNRFIIIMLVNFVGPTDNELSF